MYGDEKFGSFMYVRAHVQVFVNPCNVKYMLQIDIGATFICAQQKKVHWSGLILTWDCLCSTYKMQNLFMNRMLCLKYFAEH